MELTQLRYFKALAETGSLTRTAEKLYITPPALSTAITRLEHELETTLFDRGKSLVLNERGQIFLDYITQSLDAIDDAKRAVREMNGSYQLRLSVGVASAVVWHNLFLDFMEAYPDIALTQTLVTLPDLTSKRILESYDFVIAAPEDLSTENLHSVPLYDDDRAMLMVAAEHPLAKLPGVSLGDLREENFIALSPGTSSRRFFDLLFSIAGFTPRIVVECGPQMRRMLVMEGRGIGVATAHTRKLNEDAAIRFVEIDNPVYRRSQSLYWHAKRYQTQATRAFRTFAVNYFKKGFIGA